MLGVLGGYVSRGTVHDRVPTEGGQEWLGRYGRLDHDIPDPLVHLFCNPFTAEPRIAAPTRDTS